MPKPAGLLGRLRRHAAHLARLDLRTVVDLLRASRELAVARWRLVSLAPGSLAMPVDPKINAPAGTDDVDRIIWAVRAMGARVPWRSDCLVQALAAQRWLRRRGIGSAIHLGVRSAPSAIDAHAWLKVGDEVVLGGEAGDYAEIPLVRPEGRTPR